MSFEWYGNVSHFYEEYEDPGPESYKVLRESTKTARKPHHCHVCEWSIQPGQRYRETVWLPEGKFEILRQHDDRDLCIAGMAKAEAAEKQMILDQQKELDELHQFAADEWMREEAERNARSETY